MLIILTIVFGFVLLVWWFVKNKYSYWKQRGVPQIEPSIPYGNLKGIGKTINKKDFIRNVYLQHKNTTPMIGVYFFATPIAIILDLDLAKNILIKDFSLFQDRQMYYDEKIEPLSAHMFNLDGDKWRIARQKLSPTFTSGRLKQMFPKALEISNRLLDVLTPQVGNGAIIEIRDLLARFTIDVSGSLIYGIECNSMNDPKTEFHYYGKRVFNCPRHGEMARYFVESYPELARLLRIKQFPDDVSHFFMNIIRETINYREENNIHHNDFMDLLIQLKNTGRLEGLDEELGRLSADEIAAQAFIFFIGGYETTASNIGFVLYALCLHQDIQDKVRDEIERVIGEHGGQFSYDAMKDMKYLQRVVDETLRIYSQATYITRKAMQTYPVPNTSYTIEKDTVIIIPIEGFNFDPDIYPNPEVFDPDRFLPEKIAERNQFAYMPFGDGPRNCIGSRLAKMVSNIGLVTLLRNFRFKPSEKTPIPLEFENDVIVLKSTKDYNFCVEKL